MRISHALPILNLYVGIKHRVCHLRGINHKIDVEAHNGEDRWVRRRHGHQLKAEVIEEDLHLLGHHLREGGRLWGIHPVMDHPPDNVHPNRGDHQ